MLTYCSPIMNILLLNGPNLSCLGKREPGLYGTETLDAIVQKVRDRGKALGVEIEAFQSNVEGELVSRILDSHGRIDGIIFNPAAYTHTSVALRDAIQAVRIPCVEVHLSNTAAREDFRRASLTAGACLGQIMGFGALSYELALVGLVEHLSSCRARKKKKR